MNSLTTLQGDASTDHLLQALERDGACILADVVARPFRERVLGEIGPYIEATGTGRDDFSGRQTTRTGALVARSPACRELVMNARVIGGARIYLGRFADRILLHLTQVIRLLPGQGSQLLHRDRVAWGKHLPASVEPQFNTMWALTDFTNVNGATRVAPGSHRWDPERQAVDAEVTQAVMPAGSVLIYSGSVIHSGGENRSNSPRVGINITYCLGWLRQEENQYLSCPPEVARTLDPELQELLGYTMGGYALGYYSDPAMPRPGTSDIRAPEQALGRKPRKNIQTTGSQPTAEPRA